MTPIAEPFLEAPDEQLDASMKPLIEKWSDPPTSLEILEVLDKCIFSSLASGLVVTALQMFYNRALQAEGKTHEDNVPLATWRNEV